MVIGPGSLISLSWQFAEARVEPADLGVHPFQLRPAQGRLTALVEDRADRERADERRAEHAQHRAERAAQRGEKEGGGVHVHLYSMSVSDLLSAHVGAFRCGERTDERAVSGGDELASPVHFL